MSRRWWLPTQKGTQLFPQTTVQPTKLVISGVPFGTALYDAAVARFGGRLKQFHGKQQQNYSLSVLRQHKGRIDWGDARAQYTNIDGQEVLELQVSEKAFHELRKDVAKRIYLPKWAVIELTIPVIQCNGYMIARYVNGHIPGITEWPHLMPIPFETAIEWSNNLESGTTERTTDTYFDFAFSNTYTVVGQEKWMGSILIDLEPFWGFPTIGIELYGHGYAYIAVTQEPAGYAFFAQQKTYTISGGGTWSGVEWNPGRAALDADFNSISGANSPTDQEFYEVRHPELAGLLATTDFSGVGSVLIESYYDATSHSLQLTGNSYLIDGFVSSSVIDDYYTVDADNQYPGDYASPVQVALLPPGIPVTEWDGAMYQTQDTPGASVETEYNRWYRTNNEDIPFTAAGSALVTVVDADIALDTPQHLAGGYESWPELPFLGVVTIDLERWGYGFAQPVIAPA